MCSRDIKWPMKSPLTVPADLLSPTGGPISSRCMTPFLTMAASCATAALWSLLTRTHRSSRAAFIPKPPRGGDEKSGGDGGDSFFHVSLEHEFDGRDRHCLDEETSD